VEAIGGACRVVLEVIVRLTCDLHSLAVKGLRHVHILDTVRVMNHIRCLDLEIAVVGQSVHGAERIRKGGGRICRCNARKNKIKIVKGKVLDNVVLPRIAAF